MQNLALVALGGNLFSSTGSPARTLCAALCALPAEGMKVVAVSRFWRSPAYPPGSGPDYVNAAAVVRTALGPEDTLAALHRIEATLGRTRSGGRWQARGIDLDLLAMGDLVLPDAATQDQWRALPPEQQVQAAPRTLILPHPRMQDRGFVLAPLAEVAPLWRHPRTGQTVSQMLAALDPAALDGLAPLG
ncbi:2-amino-4-hydroxy-6-hydroxymethyldihydropteridine diphosphokinase [Paracoccus niistensis]|uniref:2-amino-4-hydroxy-6-hydroxymethyldihydropteridine pyrophosphokinase n=1 Tax=Paracoccus niistensis TaxID=632935 RepID=A0ABV6I7V4_9RHOB